MQNCQLSLSLSSSLLFLSCSSLSQLARIIRSVSTSVTPPFLSMSTSTSTAPPSALGECVVCGKESSSRCSSCAKGGVDWMYFCSREHQKMVRVELSTLRLGHLAHAIFGFSHPSWSPPSFSVQIWNIHKHLCGRVFKWPALTQQDKAEMCELSTKEFEEPDSGTTTTWLAGYRTAVVANGIMASEDLDAKTLSAGFEVRSVHLLDPQLLMDRSKTYRVS